MNEVIEQMWIDIERKAFEAWVGERYSPAWNLACRKNGDDFVRYEDRETTSMFVAWLGRARIERDRVTPCSGVSAVWCNYTAVCGSVCNKCGKVHWPRRDHG